LPLSFAERGGWWVVFQLALMVLYVVALAGTDPISEGIALGFARLTGIGLMAIAAVIGVWSFNQLGREISIFPAPTDNAALVRSGPYRLVRHPIYLAVILGAVGLALAALNPFALLVGLVFIPFFMAKTGHEEEMLVEQFPEYRDYRSAVPYRLIPYVM
jgi:protein-S-isoprenylcysteine O-methyltransferase Ste14